MITQRILTAVLAGVSVLSLAACSEETPTTSAQPPAATTTAAAPAATTETTTPPPAAAALSDKEVCEAANKAKESMTKAMTTLFQTTGDITAKDQAAILTDMAKELDKATAGSDTEAAKALKTISAQATEAAAAKDPGEALDTPESAKAGKALNAACKKAGVATKY